MSQGNFLRLDPGEDFDGALALQAERHTGIVRSWNEMALQAIRDTRPGLSTAARALAILHTCMYNAWAAYDAAARQTTHGRALRLPREQRAQRSQASAMSHAAHISLCACFPSHQAGFDARMAGLGLDPSCLDDPFAPAGIGRSQAAAMLDFCRRDDAGLPFALVTPNQFRPPHPAPPHRIDDRADTDAGLPGAWCRLARQVSERDGYDDDRDVLLYFVLTHALADAAIAAADAGQAPGPGAAGAAAVVLRSFTGRNQAAAGSGQDGAPLAGQELGRKVGVWVFEKARRYWQGRF